MKLSVLVSLSLLGACIVGEDFDLEHEGDEGDLDTLHDDDPVYDDAPSDPSSSFNIGGWVIPSEIRTIGDRQSVTYTGAGSYNGGRNCGGGLLAGTRAIADYVKATFAGTDGYGGYACRPNTANTSQLSVHGTGRAVDIMIPLKNGDANNAIGDQIANFLVKNAQAMGVQFIIWDRNSWGASRTLPKLRAYSGPNPHTDHIHLEISPDGARKLTSWFGSNPPPPPPSNTAKVDASTLNVRSGPATSYAVLTTIPRGTTVTIVAGPSNGWYQVTYQATTGWASAAYLAF